MANSTDVKTTPCIGVCSTGIGDTVCRGCKRFCHEVIAWNGYEPQQKQAVLDRLQLLLGQVVKDKFTLLDKTQLQLQMEQQRIRYNAHLNAHCWVFDLLKAGASQIVHFGEFGLAVKSPWRDKSPPELRDIIDADFYALSCAHYQRYFLLTRP